MLSKDGKSSQGRAEFLRRAERRHFIVSQKTSRDGQAGSLLGSKTSSKGVKEPTVRIDLFLIFLLHKSAGGTWSEKAVTCLHAEDDLYRDMFGWIRRLELVARVNPD